MPVFMEALKRSIYLTKKIAEQNPKQIIFHFFLCALKTLINQTIDDLPSINDIFSLLKTSVLMLISFCQKALIFFQICRTVIKTILRSIF